MVNIFRQAYEIITTKTCGEMTDEEAKLVSLTLSFVATQLSRVEPKYDNELISVGLLRLAELIEEQERININQKGRPCPFQQIICQEGYCSDCYLFPKNRSSD